LTSRLVGRTVGLWSLKEDYLYQDNYKEFDPHL
jgi:hypothetical protein